MGLRDSIKKRVSKVLNQFSGEYSAPAPEVIEPYQRGVVDENVEVVMARIARPGEASKPAGKNARKIDEGEEG
jgi:hypothetical protein